MRDRNPVGLLAVTAATFFATSRTTGAIARSTQVVYIASANMFRGITGAINLVLLGIMAVTAIVASITAAGVASSISRPISRLSLHAKQLGSGGFTALPADESSLEIAELTKSINEMSDRLRKYDQAQKDFLQNASHELRTPLMSIGGYAEGLVTGVFTDAKETAAIICEESRRMTSLVEELLTLSRIENGSQDVQLTTVNICDFMKDCVQKAGGLALKHGKLLALECGSADITVKTDEGLLRQILLNVIANGLKYAAKQVRLSVEVAGGRPVIRIADDGDGIAAADLPHIFERFYKGKGGSFGLGLAIADSAAKAIGGTIRAYNDGGAVFEIKL